MWGDHDNALLRKFLEQEWVVMYAHQNRQKCCLRQCDEPKRENTLRTLFPKYYRQAKLRSELSGHYLKRTGNFDQH